eukprot:1374675-Amorphochlora_amoeboformis.AAC.1
MGVTPFQRKGKSGIPAIKDNPRTRGSQCHQTVATTQGSPAADLIFPGEMRGFRGQTRFEQRYVVYLRG